jgi:hypothetical protein
MHGHQVEVITGRENTPTEYHCGYCGNYAIVGVNAQFPFMVAVKAESESAVVSEDVWKGLAHYSSPMQVGESLVKSGVPRARQFTRRAQQAVSTEEKPAEKCKPKEESMDDFFLKHGITREEYKANKKYKLESPARVAKRMGRTGQAEQAAPQYEQKLSLPETKPPQDEQGTPKPEKKVAARVIGWVGKDHITIIGCKDYITIVAKEEFIEKIKEAADRDFRTPEQQVAYYLHKGMEAVGV